MRNSGDAQVPLSLFRPFHLFFPFPSLPFPNHEKLRLSATCDEPSASYQSQRPTTCRTTVTDYTTTLAGPFHLPVSRQGGQR